MKKVLQFVVASVVGATMFGGVALAADPLPAGCSIDNTGANSVNVCVDSNNQVVNAVCVNNLFVDSRNVQGATSGATTVTLNTNGGGATSGNATNSNNAIVSLGASCQGGFTTAAATPAPTPAVGGSGGGAGAAAPAAAPAPAPVSLPNTGSSELVSNVVMATAVVAGSVVALQAGLMAYRRLAVK
jgi:hypothetical protein